MPHLRRALQINRALHGDIHPAVGDCLILLGRALTFMRNEESIEVQREALAIRRKLFDENGPEVAWAKTCLGFALWRSTPPPQRAAPERLAEAELLAFEALDVQRPLREVNGLELAISLHTVAAMHSYKSEKEKAAEVFPEAIEVYRSLPEQEDRYLVESVHGYANVLWTLGRTEKEEPLWREYLERTPREFFPDNEPCNALRRLGALVRLKAASATDSATATALFEESTDFYRRAVAAECEN